MPTVFTHPAVPLALGLGMGKGLIPAPLLLAGVAASVLPDLDIIAFRLGIPYAAGFGHRGCSHSLLFAVLIALIGACSLRACHVSFLRAFMFLFIAAVSHGILDAFTNGGLGVAFFWPWSTERHFAPVQVVEVAPLSLSRLLTQRGAAVLLSELVWIWLPCTIIGLAMFFLKAYLNEASGLIRSPGAFSEKSLGPLSVLGARLKSSKYRCISRN